MTPERETPHVAHGTGHRWLDLTLALSAMLVSIVSLAVAVHHGNAMDRLVAANSWPFLMYDTDNIDPQGHRRILLKVEMPASGRLAFRRSRCGGRTGRSRLPPSSSGAAA
jgi:hypothetical protein